jgi:RNAse (barnase) inhibitor barstar
MIKHTYTIDGNDFDTLEELYEKISETMLPGIVWGHNLDALNDVLYGDFGVLKEEFILIWKNAARSRQKLGYEYTIEFWEKRLVHNPDLKEKLEKARQHKGQTVFDVLMEIIYDHPQITLILE